MKMTNLTSFSTKISRYTVIYFQFHLPEATSVEFKAYELEFDSNSDKLLDLGPMNSNENIYNEDTEMGSFLTGNLNFNKGKVIIDNKVLSHELKHMKPNT